MQEALSTAWQQTASCAEESTAELETSLPNSPTMKEHFWRAQLKSLSSEELNEFIESKVHTDLEGIRINGAITGLAAGGLFYFLLEYAYIPFMHQFM